MCSACRHRYARHFDSIGAVVAKSADNGAGEFASVDKASRRSRWCALVPGQMQSSGSQTRLNSIRPPLRLRG